LRPSVVFAPGLKYHAGVNQHLPKFCFLTALLTSARSGALCAQNFIQNTVQDFQESDFVFQRSGSNAPFLPVSYLGSNYYGEAQINNEITGETLEYTQRSASAFAGLPFVIGKKDAWGIGAYLSNTRFDTRTGSLDDDFRVNTVGLPMGWFRQVNTNWQAAAFVMPMAHRSTQDTSDWTVQTMAGGFARYAVNERFWWAVGVFGEYSPNDSYVIPYAGASWVINPQWTLSAVMPWPAILYAPNTDWLFSLGASPSGASWSLQPERNEVAISLDAWDFGLTAERRIFKNVWLAARTGIGGLRGLRLDTQNGTIQAPDITVGSSGFFSLSLRLRPGAQP
jgi:hypothetical protein